MSETTQPKGHIVHRFDNDLDAFKNTVLKMGEVVCQQVGDATVALLNHQVGLAQMVLRREDWVDDFEIRADEMQLNLLITRQPTGPDLRAILALGRTVRDLERIGDEAQKVAELTVQLDTKAGPYPSEDLLVDVASMSEAAVRAVTWALELIRSPSTSRAVELARSDYHFSQEFGAGLRRAVTFVLEDPRNVGVVVSLALVLRSLERVGDHAQNIAEHVIFQQRGKDIRHRDVREIENSLVEGGPLSEPPLEAEG